MDIIQQRIMEIAQQIPDYVGYQEKERRRDANELVRRQLAAKYDEQRARLARLQRQAPLDSIVALENLDQKLLRLIARFRTATGGYAGWFDAAQIVESDLDQLTQFDSSLAGGVDELKKKLDAIGRRSEIQERAGRRHCRLRRHTRRAERAVRSARAIRLAWQKAVAGTADHKARRIAARRPGSQESAAKRVGEPRRSQR